MSSLKHSIRQDMRSQRADVGEKQRAQACGYVCDQLLSIPLAEGDVVAGYWPTYEEINISKALSGLHARNIPVVLPTVTDAELMLVFKEWWPGITMDAAAFGILEPQGGKSLVPTVVILPVLAFDRKGYRLGYGGGYYDATLEKLIARNPKLRMIGIGYSFQEVDALPVEAHDVPLSMIITDKETIVIPSAAEGSEQHQERSLHSGRDDKS